MMKKIILFGMSIFLSGIAMASISINLTLTGNVDNGTVTPWSTSDRLVQLIWSKDAPVSSAIFGTTDYLATGEYLLWSSTALAYGKSLTDMDAAAVYSTSAQYSGSQDINSGYIFARVFGSSTVVSSTKYFESVYSASVPGTLTSYSALDPSSVINYNISSVSQTAATQTMTVVPEPSSVALFALGLGVLALRRKLRK
ncbi:MAG: PEP-CTERM sorting domain-containing protein [bacterium]